MITESALKPTARRLFGNSDRSPIEAFHFENDADGSVPLNKNTVTILLSHSGTFTVDHERQILRCGVGEEGIAIMFQQIVFAKMLEPFRPGLHPSIRPFLGEVAELPVFEPELPRNLAKRLFQDMSAPPISGPALPFYFEAKIKELIAFGCFGKGEVKGEFFCTRQKRICMDRISKAMGFLKNHLDEPLDLQRVADEAGCSASYLSRTFSARTGFTLSQYFRKCRIEKAAELLISGRYTVSEAAIEVGYNSLSHFSKAFQKEKGVLPSRFEAA
jgi:AraC-like DNA-binding protein